MNQFAEYTPYFGAPMQAYQPNQNVPQNMGDPAIQKLLQDQVRQQIMMNFAPQNAGADFFSTLQSGAPTAPVAPPAVADVIKKKKNGGGGTAIGSDGTPNPHLIGMWQADRYI